MQGRKGYIVLLLLALVMAGCKVNEPEQKLCLPLSICLPANEVQSARHAPAARRAIGDPGETESFLFPRHLYIIVMKQDEDTKAWTVWDTINCTLTDADWKPTRYVGLLPTDGDSIYQYTEQINLLLSSSDHFKGRVYAIASSEKLSFNKTLNTITDLNDLLSLTFNTSTPAIQSSLQHIYSSPYNLTQDGDYYGSFNSIYQRVPHVNLLLYHVAAKVDIKWSVDEEKRINKTDPSQAIRLTYMKAKNLFNGYAYCFKPMENTQPGKLASGYSREIITAESEGLWWEGRYYFYTIPYTVTGNPGYFPLQMEMSTNGSSAKYRPTLNMQMNTSSPFVPWMRAMFNISNKLTDTEETKTIDL